MVGTAEMINRLFVCLLSSGVCLCNLRVWFFPKVSADPLHLHVCLLWSAVGLFIVRVNISRLGRLVRGAAASNRRSQIARTNEREQQEGQRVDPDLPRAADSHQLTASWSLKPPSELQRPDFK